MSKRSWIDILKEDTWVCKIHKVTIGGDIKICPLCDCEQKDEKHRKDIAKIMKKEKGYKPVIDKRLLAMHRRQIQEFINKKKK